MRVWKGHAYGNDFLMMRADEVEARGTDPISLARKTCARHTGIGADGLILFDEDGDGVRMRLINPDGSHAEVSGNGVRCLAALVAHESRGASAGVSEVVIYTDAGPKTLTPIAHDELERRTADLRLIDLELAGTRVRAAALNMGNPQCILLDQPLTIEALHRFGPLLQNHPEFPQQVNVEIIKVEDERTVKILIWERGVGPTESSGTGSCASAVAAIAYAGASRAVDVIAPGGSQRVEWDEDGEVYLTGWAQIVLDGQWMA
jgi:diaminopimelate epimerase